MTTNKNLRPTFKALFFQKLSLLGLLAMLLFLALDVYFLAKHEQEKVEAEFSHVQDFVSDGFVLPAGEVDAELVMHKLHFINHFTYVQDVDVVLHGKTAMSSLERSFSKSVTREYPLMLTVAGQADEIGYVSVTADVSSLYVNVARKSIPFLLTEGALVLLLVYGVYWSMGKKLFQNFHHITAALQELDLDNPYQKLKLPVASQQENYAELDDLVNAVNEQKRRLAATHHEFMLSQDKFFKIFNSSPDAILITSFETGQLVDVNKSFYRLYEFDESDQVIGKTAQELGMWVDAESREEWKQFLESEGPIYMRETKYRKKTGKSSDCITSMQIIDFGDMLGLVTVVRDISETKRYQAELIHSRQRLHNLARNQNEIREKERIGISREIHDELGQAFTGLKIDLFRLNEHLESDEYAKEKILGMIESVDASVDTVRRISSELRPSVLDDLGLEAAIEWFTADFSARTNIKHHLNIGCDDLSLVQHRDTAIFRIYQETLTNIARHSQATEFTVTLRSQNNCIELCVQDNGIGITDDQLNADSSIGIIGMQERAANIGATVDIRNQSGGGAEVTLTCPLEEMPLN